MAVLAHLLLVGMLIKNAKKYGFADWKTIYNHSVNSDFRRKRQNSNPNVLIACANSMHQPYAISFSSSRLNLGADCQLKELSAPTWTDAK